MVLAEHFFHTGGRRAGFCFAVAALLAAGCAKSSSRKQGVLSVTEGPALPISTASHAGGLVGGKPVVVGGTHWSDDKTTKRWLHECFVYRGGVWLPGPAFPRPVSDAAFAFDRDGLIVAGGSDGKAMSAAVMRLTSKAGQLAWQPLPPLPEAVQASAGAILDGKFYVAGGYSEGKTSNRLWMLDLRATPVKWTALAPLPAPGRGYFAFVPIGGELLLLGGLALPPYEKDVTIFDDAYRYRPASNSWSKIEGLRLPGYAWTATAIDRHRVMLTGRVARIGETSREILILDLKTLVARPAGNLVTPACCMPVLPMGPQTWWLPGGEPDTNRSRTARTSIVTFDK